MAVYQYTKNRIDRNTYLDEYMDYEGFKRKVNGMTRLQGGSKSGFLDIFIIYLYFFPKI